MRRAVLSFVSVSAVLLLGLVAGVTSASSGSVTASPTLVVAVLGGGSVTSAPAGISCPGACKATFATGTSVLLTAKASTGSRFIRWGGNCSGAGACRVKVSALSAVAAEFTAGSTTPPPGAKLPAVAGSYSGSTHDGFSLTFFVPAGGGTVVNISIGDVNIACTPTGNFPGHDQLVIPETAIKPDGSFAAKTSQDGVFAGAKARFTYSFHGRFQGSTAGGSFREDIAFTIGATKQMCTSNNESWNATRTHDPQPPQKSVIKPGSYSGSTHDGFSVTFSVPAGGGSVVNVSIGDVNIACTPTGNFPGHDQLEISATAIKPDGSFIAKSSQHGVFAGVNAKFTYFFGGHFQGLTASKVASVAGTFREDIVFTDTTGHTHTCTSNLESWSATRSG